MNVIYLLGWLSFTCFFWWLDEVKKIKCPPMYYFAGLCGAYLFMKSMN